MTTGVITNEPSPDWQGDTLAAAATTGATSLVVDEALDFDDDDTRSRWLVVGESDPLEYTAVDHDTNTITLAVPTTEDYEAGLPVVLWDPTADAKVIEYLAPVRLTDGSGTVDAVIPHEKIPLNGVDNLVGASVSLTEDGGEWYVSQVFAREATLDAVGRVQTTTAGVRMAFEPITGGGRLAGYSDLADEGGPSSLFMTAATDSFGNPYHLVTLSSGFRAGHSSANVVVQGEDENNEEIILLDAATTRAGGALRVDSLASGGTHNAASGSRYARVDDSGVVYSSTTAPSSRAVKHDIADLDVEVEAVLGLRPVTFRYNDDPDAVRVGFIAEEADELGLSCLVGYEDRENPDRPTGFAYDGFGAALLLVVQRQQAQIEALSDRVAVLESSGVDQ